MTKISVFFFLTQSCNLACSHCYVSASPKLKSYINLKTFKKIIDLLLVQNIKDIRLTGGEPTIHPEFEQILQYLASKRISPRLITNGIRLMRMKSPENILARISACWISTYGLTNSQHLAIGGKRNRPLQEILEFVGKQAKINNHIGVSALLTATSIEELYNFIELSKKCGVKRLRFLFAEPSGRAVSTQAIFQHAKDVRSQATEIANYLRLNNINNEFDFLSINNPFDIDSSFESEIQSCMLSSRRMWSISPEGDIYSCCYNIYNSKHFVSSALASNAIASLKNLDAFDKFSNKCDALRTNFWGNLTNKISCPISALNFSMKT